MKKIYDINKKSSLKKNLQQVVPEMFNDFFSYASVVTGYPLRKTQLHEMRKAGKPLRYAMELGEYCFTGDFKLCLDEVKSALDLMGEVHDADVMIPDISLHMKEIRSFNLTLNDKGERFSTKQLREAVLTLRKQRLELYAELCIKLNMWKESNFREKIIIAMQQK